MSSIMSYCPSSDIAMPHSGSKISLYADRSISQCLETTFDFMRSCRSVWFRMALWLFMPLCSLVVVVFYGNVKDFEGIDALFGSMRIGLIIGVVVVVFVLFMLLPLLMVYSLLDAYGEHGDDIDGFSMGRMLPYIRRNALRVCWLTIFFALTFSFFAIGGVVALLLWFLLALLPSVYIIERQGFFPSLTKSVRLAFRSFFQLVGVFFFSLMFGFLMLMALAMPFELMSTAGDVFSFSASSTSPVGLLFSYTYYIIVIMALCMLFSMLLLALAFQYGSASEWVDDASLESDIERFENL